MSSGLHTPELFDQISTINRELNNINDRITNLQNLFGNSASLSQLKLSEKRLKQLISANDSIVRQLENKLSMINTPEETRFYLEQSEVEDFRSNFQKLAAMIADVNDLYNTMVAYVSNLK